MPQGGDCATSGRTCQPHGRHIGTQPTCPRRSGTVLPGGQTGARVEVRSRGMPRRVAPPCDSVGISWVIGPGHRSRAPAPAREEQTRLVQGQAPGAPGTGQGCTLRSGPGPRGSPGPGGSVGRSCPGHRLQGPDLEYRGTTSTRCPLQAQDWCCPARRRTPALEPAQASGLPRSSSSTPGRLVDGSRGHLGSSRGPDRLPGTPVVAHPAKIRNLEPRFRIPVLFG